MLRQFLIEIELSYSPKVHKIDFNLDSLNDYNKRYF